MAEQSPEEGHLMETSRPTVPDILDEDPPLPTDIPELE